MLFRSTRPLVLHTEVTNLPNLSGFLRFGRNLPVVRFSDAFHDLRSVAPAFVERTAPPHREARAQAVIRQIVRRARSRSADGPDENGDAAEQTAPTQGDMFGGVAPVQVTESAPGVGTPDAGDGTPSKPAPHFRSMAPVPGSTRIELDYHDRSDGPRRKATPA